MSNFKAGDLVRYTGVNHLDVERDHIYKVMGADSSCCILIDGAGDEYWVSKDEVEKVQNEVDSETKGYTLKISLHGGDIQSSHESTLKLESDEEALSLFVDLLQIVQ